MMTFGSGFRYFVYREAARGGRTEGSVDEGVAVCTGALDGADAVRGDGSRGDRQQPD